MTPFPIGTRSLIPREAERVTAAQEVGVGSGFGMHKRRGCLVSTGSVPGAQKQVQETGPGCYRALALKSVAAQETGHGKASPVCPVLLVPNRISQAMAKKCVADPPSFKMPKEEKTNQPSKQTKQDKTRSLCHCVTSLSSSQGHETFYFWSRHTCPLSLPHRVRV